MYLVRTPDLLKPFFKDLLWDLRGPERAVYLTFDDGPIPEVTPWVLDQLAAYNARATFFCIGRNVKEDPVLFRRLRQEGHSVGNHTWDHADGWKTPLFTYLRSVSRCQEHTGSTLFRPPYGHITREQVKALVPRFRVVMWEVLSADFDVKMDGDTCVQNVIGHIRPGSIVVFHDSLKAWDRLHYALPLVLAFLQKEGYAMKAIPEN